MDFAVDQFSYDFFRVPYAHQERTFQATRNAEYWGILFEQRCGKSQVLLDTIAWNYERGRITGAIIIAPNGVHRVWAEDEIRDVLPPRTNYRVIFWQAGKCEGKRFQKYAEDSLRHDGLLILCVNVDALLTKSLQQYFNKFIKARRAFMAALDEAVDISNPKAQRTKIAVKLSRYAAMRRILEGTPGAAKPLGLYSQFDFLREGALGFTSYFAFRNRYAVYETKIRHVWDDVRKRHVETTYPELIGYRNEAELAARVARYSTRVTRAQCVDLPPKIYQKRYVSLTPEQRRVYENLREEFRTDIQQGGNVTAAMQLTRIMRLQQIASNHVTTDSTKTFCVACSGEGCELCGNEGFVGAPGHVVPVDPNRNPRLDELERVLDGLDGKVVIWARFTPDVDDIVARLRQKGHAVARYDGVVGNTERAENLEGFRLGDIRYFVGKARAGGRGLDLSMAPTCIYYSHDWSLRYRLQSEDRLQNLGLTRGVLYIDIIASDTKDEEIITALRSGKSLADLIAGDPHGEWI